MTRRLPISPEETARIISAAFSPLRCAAEPADYRNIVRFGVFDEKHEPLLRMDKVTSTGFGSASGLRSTIEAARSNLTRRGIKLDPWTMPPVSDDQG